MYSQTVQVVAAKMPFFWSPAHKEEHARSILEPFTDRRVNKCLIYRVLDCALLNILPELVTSTPQELIELRVPA